MSAAFSSPQVWAFPVTAVGRACRGFPFLVPSRPVGCRVPAALVCSVFKRGWGAACPSRCDSLTFVCHHISAGQSQERALILRTPTMTPSPLGGQKEWLHLQVGNVWAQGGRPQNVPQWHNDGFELVVCQAARARRGMSRLCCPSNAGHKSPPGKVLSLLPEAERDTVGLASKVRGSRAGRLT